MMSLRLISRFIGLSPTRATSLFTLRGDRDSPRDAKVNALSLDSASALDESDNEEREHHPTWPPPDGVYWGM